MAEIDVSIAASVHAKQERHVLARILDECELPVSTLSTIFRRLHIIAESTHCIHTFKRPK